MHATAACKVPGRNCRPANLLKKIAVVWQRLAVLGDFEVQLKLIIVTSTG